MKIKSVQLLRQCKTPKGWKRLPVVFNKNGRLRAGLVLYEGNEVSMPGHYVLRSTVAGRTKWTNVGDDSVGALTARDRAIHIQKANQAAIQAGATLVVDPLDRDRQNLIDKQALYLARLSAQGKLTTITSSRIAITEFLKITGVSFADQLSEDVILKWYAGLRKKGNQDRTLWNKHTNVFAFLKWLKVDTKALASHPPSYTKRDVEIYSETEMTSLFESLPDGYLKMACETFHKAGLRENELAYLEWQHIDLKAGMIKVREYNHEGGKSHRIKDRGERSVPIPQGLVDKLKCWKAARPGTALVFGTNGDLPNTKLLRTLKRAAKNVGLNCGRCAGCKGKLNECRLWTLKRFRSTYITTLLRNGLDIRTVMDIVGHEDMETTMKYLAVAKGPSTMKKINEIKWT